MFPDELRTDRLRLRRVTVSDAPLSRLYERFRAGGPGEAVFEHVPDEPFDHLGDAVDHCESHEGGWDARESVHYFVEPTEIPTELSRTDGLLADGGAADASAFPDRSDAAGAADDSRESLPLAGIASAWWLWERDVAKLGLLLAPSFWGRNYALETNIRLTELAFDRLDLGAVQIGHTVGNEKSRSAVETYVERFDGRREGVIRNAAADGDPVDVARYVVTRANYDDAR
ncbi:MAG: GNAT family N-acetyltransferase [Halobaculum sp.]